MTTEQWHQLGRQAAVAAQQIEQIERIEPTFHRKIWDAAAELLPPNRSTGKQPIPDRLRAVDVALLAAVAPRFPSAPWRELEAAVTDIAPATIPPLGQLAELPACEFAYGWQWALAACAPQQRRKHGAFYTPRDVVRFMTRGAADLVRDISPSSPIVIDPAAGTGAFLLESANSPTRSARLIAWEWMPAAAILCHHLLAETSSDAQVNVGSALAQPSLPGLFGTDLSGESPLVPGLFGTDLSGESPLAPGLFGTDLSGESPLVIIGNPPYSNFSSVNDSQTETEWLMHELSAYKRGLTERKHNLHDDFIKFFRWAELQMAAHGSGVLAYITNNTFLSGLTHRIMRRSLLDTFDRVHVLDLGGAQFQGDRPSGHRQDIDENIFGIRQGVCISFWQKFPRPTGNDCEVRTVRLRGDRAQKFEQLARQSEATSEANSVEDFDWRSVVPLAPHWSFTSTEVSSVGGVHQAGDRNSAALARAYNHWPSLTDLCRSYVSGVQTKQDKLFIDVCADQLREKMRRAIHDPSAYPPWLKKRLELATFDARHIQPCQVAPWDFRWMYYDPALLGRARYEVMRHLLEPENCGLVFMRQSTNTGEYDHFLATDMLVTDRVFHSRRGAPFVAPWRLYNDPGSEPEPNLTSRAQEVLPPRLRTDLELSIEQAERIWNYIYAVVHATTYRTRFPISHDFPRIPPASDDVSFTSLADLGRQLATCHMAASQPLIRWARSARDLDEESKSKSKSKSKSEFEFEFARQWRVGGVLVVERCQRKRPDLPEHAWKCLSRIAAETATHRSAIDAIVDPMLSDAAVGG